MKTKLFTLGIIFMMLCVLLTSCFGNSETTTKKPAFTTPDASTTEKPTTPPEVKYTVTFMNGADVYKTVQVVEGEAVGAPQAPAKAGTESTHFVFDGWYNGEEKWNFETGVTADLTLNAKFTEQINIYEVKILDLEGNVVSTQQVVHGTKLTQPETPNAPTAEGTTFTFDGWYNGNKKWDFENDYVSSSVSLKPVYASELIDVAVRFELQDGTVIESTTVKYGQTPACSTTPTMAGTSSKVYVFAGWDKELGPVTAETVYVAQFKEYSVGIGNTDTFKAETIYESKEDKFINACYKYSSISGSSFPIVVQNEALVFNVFNVSTFGVLSIDLGSVKAGVTYYLSMDLVMKDVDGNLLKDGFAYAFSANPDVTTSGAALTSYSPLTVNGANGFLYKATQDLDHLYFCIRSQKDKGYMESTATIDNVLLKEVNLSGANISNGTVTEDFSDGIVFSEKDGNNNDISNWYGNVRVYSPNKNAVVYAQDGKLYAKAEQSGQKGLVGFYIDGIVAGKSYEVTMDLNLYDANGADKTSGFTMMVYANGAFTGTRYNLYLGDGDTNLTITPTADKVSNNGKVTFKFTATQDGYVIVTLRANSAPLYAEIDNFSMKEIPTYTFIKFVDENGNQIGETVKYEAGQEIQIPAALTKDPSDTTVYTFDGWYNGETKLEAGAKATTSATYTAKFAESAREYTITYYNDDDTVYQTVKVPYGASVELIAVPEKGGQTGTWVGAVYATMPAQNISYKVSYTVVSYTATITLNGEAYSTETFTAGNREAVLAKILGNFVNDPQYTYTHAIPAELPLEDCTYNVVRTVNEYTVKFVVDGVEETFTLAYGATPAPSATPTKTGYTFKGWTPAIATVTGDATYTAQFVQTSLDVTEDFENGSINWRDYTGSSLNAKRPNENSSWEIVDYNGSKALAVSKAVSSSGGYAGIKVDVKPNTTYVVTLDLAAVGATTADLSSSSAILFEVYENCNIGGSTRISMFSNTGRALTTNQKISSFKSGTQYQVVFTTSDFEGESGYVYFAIRLDKTLTEDTTVYLDNVRVNECVTTINENFDDVTTVTDTVAKGANSTVTVENGALKATCTATKQGFLGVYVKVEAGKTYFVNFDATVKGADGTDYSAGTKGGESATFMIFQNTSSWDNSKRLTFMACKANNNTVNNTSLSNVLNVAVPNYSTTFTATEDGYVYIALRTNNIAQESYLTFDNLIVSELELN